MSKSKPITYKNTTYASLKQLSETSDMSYQTLRKRICNLGWSVERAMETPLRNAGIPSFFYKGTEYPSLYSLSRTFGITLGTLDYHINKLGWSVDKTIATLASVDTEGNPIDINVTLPITYNDKRYTSVVQLEKDYGIKIGTLYHRMRIQNMSLEQVLETLVKDTNMPVVYNGETYSSIVALATAKHMHAKTVQSRIDRGYTVEQAIETPIRNTDMPVVYNGETYSSIVALATAKHMDVSTVRSRITKGWTVEQAIDTPSRVVYKKKGYIDSKLFTILDRTDSTVTIKCPLCTHVFSKPVVDMSGRKRLICPNCNYNSIQKKRYTKLVGKTYYGYTIISFEYKGRQSKEPYFLIKHNDELLPKPMTMYELLCLIKDKTE